eukprot:gene16393-biopygen8440
MARHVQYGAISQPSDEDCVRTSRNHGARHGALCCTSAESAPLWRRYAAIMARGLAQFAHVCREGSTVIISEDFISDSTNSVLLKKGLTGLIKLIDEGGDAIIIFDGLSPKAQMVFKDNFDKLSTGDV